MVVGYTGYSSDLPSNQYIDESIHKAALEVGVPPVLLKSICDAESNLNPIAYVHGDGGEDNHAFGMCQVLRLTAKQLGLQDPNCKADFSEIPRSFETCSMFGPYTNSLYAAKYLKSQLDRYDGSWIAAIASYNSGSLKTCESKGFYSSRNGDQISCIPGAPINQKYVDRVLQGIYKYRQKKS